MENNYSIEEILIAVDDFNRLNAKKSKKNF